MSSLLRLPKKLYFKRGSLSVALSELGDIYKCKKAFIVTDSNVYRLGVVDPVIELLSKQDIRFAEYFNIGDPVSLDGVLNGVPKMQNFEPDVIIAVGGPATMCAAKLLWLMYENPDADIKALADKYSAADADPKGFPKLGLKAMFVTVATTPECIAYVTPFASVTDRGEKLTVASFSFLPEIAVMDSQFMLELPKENMIKGGMRIIGAAVSAYLADNANDYNDGFVKDAVKLVLDNLEDAIKLVPTAIDSISNAAAIAAVAFGNTVSKHNSEAVNNYPSDQDRKVSGDAKARVLEIAKYCGAEGDSDDKILESWFDDIAALRNL